MERVTQQTAASAEETAASSEQLAQDVEQSRSAVRELARLVDAETERREPSVKVAAARPALRRAA